MRLRWACSNQVLSTLPTPPIDLVMPLTVPVKVGLANGALLLRAPCAALDMGLFESDVLSTLPRPTLDLVMPLTVPLQVGLANGALLLRAPLRRTCYWFVSV